MNHTQHLIRHFTSKRISHHRQAATAASISLLATREILRLRKQNWVEVAGTPQMYFQGLSILCVRTETRCL